MHFVKMQGAGNDFIILDNTNLSLDPDSFSRLASILCARRLAIGADGLIVVSPPEEDGDFRMIFYNSDGSEGEMCGNGARCLLRYGYEKGLAKKRTKQIRIETRSGIVTGERISHLSYRVRLNSPSVMKMAVPVTVNKKTYECAYAELGAPGLPHAVVHMPGLTFPKSRELFELAQSLRSWPGFAKGANVNFYDILPDQSVNVLTFERGVEDFTLACGTGCGCTAAVLAVKGLVSFDCISMQTPGGTLQAAVVFNEAKPGQPSDPPALTIRDLFLTGPAVWVAEGEIGDDLL